MRARVAYVHPCKRCGHLHGQTMVQRIRRGFQTMYRASNFEGSTEWPTIRDAELDACDHWATLNKTKTTNKEEN